MNKKDIIITSATRTAVGSLGKSLKNKPGHELGSTVIIESIKRSKLKNDEVDEIIMGQVLTGGTGQNPARQAAMRSGIPKEKPAISNLFLEYVPGISAVSPPTKLHPLILHPF